MDGHMGIFEKLSSTTILPLSSRVWSAQLFVFCPDFCPLPWFLSHALSPFNYNSSFLFPYTPLKCSIGTLSSMKSLILPQSKEPLGILRFWRMWPDSLGRTWWTDLPSCSGSPRVFQRYRHSSLTRLIYNDIFEKHESCDIPEREVWDGRRSLSVTKGIVTCCRLNSADDSVICYWTGVSKYFIFLEHISGCAIYFYWKMSGHGSRLTKQPSKVSGSLGSQ